MRLILILILTLPLTATDWTWRISAASHGAATVMDFHSSLGKHEANPLLRGRDGRFSPVKGAIVKSAGFTTLTTWGAKDKKHRKLWKIINFTLAGTYCLVAARNYRINKN